MSRLPRRANLLRRRVNKLVWAVAVLAAAVVAVTAVQLAGAFARTVPSAIRPSVSGPSISEQAATRGVSAQLAVTQARAAAWIVGQISGAAIIGCYPAMCASLEAQGVAASRLVPLGPSLTGVLGTDVVVTLPSTGKGVLGQDAPALIASFGSGAFRIEVRAVAGEGAVAYQSALRADRSARESAGSQLLRNPRIKLSAGDAELLTAGEVDSRVLATLAALSTQFTLRVVAFGDSSPGAPLLFREVTVASDGAGNSTARLAAALAMANEQESPYLPARAAIVRLGSGQDALLVEFAAPSPLGLLTTVLTADVQDGVQRNG